MPKKGRSVLKLSVAIDGPAGAGKSTIAQKVSKRLNLIYINTGSMYRAVTLMALEKNIPSEDEEKLSELIDSLEMHFENDNLILNGENVNEKIKTPEVSGNVSNYAAVPLVREKLVHIQKKIAQKYDVIMDGRDIGTVVLKESKFKFFLNASPLIRAKRRCEELKEKGFQVELDQILEDIKKRDYIDTHRELNPLTKASDAIEIDSSNLTIDEVVTKICNIIIDKTYSNKK